MGRVTGKWVIGGDPAGGPPRRFRAARHARMLAAEGPPTSSRWEPVRRLSKTKRVPAGPARRPRRNSASRREGRASRPFTEDRPDVREPRRGLSRRRIDRGV